MILNNKRTSTGKNGKRHQPYDMKARPKTSLPSSTDPTISKVSRTIKGRVENEATRLQHIENALAESSRRPHASSSTAATSSSMPMTTPRETLRDVYFDAVRKMYPYYTPKHAFEILTLTDGLYKGVASVEGITEYLEDEMQSMIAFYKGSREAIIRKSEKTLSVEADITGMKPRPGDFGVFIRPIPDSKYSIRLFPGSKAASEYCLDFVLSSTGEPVNSPFKFNLFSGPGPTTPVGFAPTVGLRPLECAFGIAQKDILPGAEKFLLRDGQLCTLQRPGHKDIQFTVPIRRRPELPRPDVVVLELPEYI